MDKIKCATFDKDIQDNIPKEIRDKMEADRVKAEKEQEAKPSFVKRVSDNDVAVCTHDIWNYNRCPYLKNGRDCNQCNWQVDLPY